MEQESIDVGVEIARKALYFACFSNGTVTSDKCREAIKILFGEEVDAALQNELAPKRLSECNNELPNLRPHSSSL